jgi:hypothetical protein
MRAEDLIHDVGDDYFFPDFDVSRSVDSFMFRINFLVVCIWNTVVVDEAGSGVDSTCYEAGAAGERVFPP